MRGALNIASVTVAGLVLGLAPHAADPQTARSGGAPATQVLHAEKVPKREFDRQLRTLPDSAVVEAQGRRLTVGEIRAKSVEIQKAVAAKIDAAAVDARSRFAEREKQFVQQREARLETENGRAVAGLARAREFEAIRQEAARLLERSKTATAAEQTEIERRAGQLLQQLQKIPR